MPVWEASASRGWRGPGLWNAANLLTASRLVLAPWAVREILLRNAWAAFVLIFLAGWTDLFDGMVARATHSNSAFGQLLDPIADKVLLSGVFLGLAWIGTVPAWFVWIVFGRDLLLLGASCFVMAFTAYRDLKPSLVGKASTVFQILAAGFLVLANAVQSDPVHSVGTWLLFPTAILTAASGLQYGWRGVAYFARR